MEIIGEWDDSLIWCPSQCYLKVKYMAKCFILYLRWRHHDPWTARLIECGEDFKLNTTQNEIWLNVDAFSEWSDLNELKSAAIKEAEKKLEEIYDTTHPTV